MEEGDHNQWGKLSRDCGILAKRWEGAKIILVWQFFLRNPFLRKA